MTTLASAINFSTKINVVFDSSKNLSENEFLQIVEQNETLVFKIHSCKLMVKLADGCRSARGFAKSGLVKQQDHWMVLTPFFLLL